MLPETQPILFNCPKEFDEIEIFPVHDLHYGSDCFNERKWNALRDLILSEPNRYVVWVGDLMENAIPNSKSSVFGQTCSPQAQKDYVTELFHEFKEGDTPEAKFARSLDNVQPVMQNDASNGKDWREKGICLSQAIERQRRTAQGSQILWDEVSKPMIQKNIDEGNIIGDVSLEEI